MIQAKDLSFSYPDGTVGLTEVNFEILSGQIIFLTGESGSGKTTLLKLLQGMEKPTDGELWVLDRKMNGITSKELRILRTEIGPVFQDFRLIKGRTARENVEAGLRFLNFSRSELRNESVRYLEEVGLGDKIESFVEQLSYGQLQRVAVARALARRPKLLIADEPTGNLDHENAVKIMELLTTLKDPDTIVVITTHATSIIPEGQDIRRIHVKKGRIFMDKEVSNELV